MNSFILTVDLDCPAITRLVAIILSTVELVHFHCINTIVPSH